MNKKIMHLTKNDFEGVASAILSKYIYGDNIEIKFYNYNCTSQYLINESKDYEYVIAVGLKNSYKLKLESFNILDCKNFDEMYKHYSNLFPEDFANNESAKIFYDNVVSYIDWSWSNKHLYYGKNIDELCKYLGKIEVINNVAERINNREEIVTKSEKDMLVFAKKLMTNTIQNKKYTKINKSNLNIAVTYSDNYEIELSNYILSQDKNLQVVIVINMNSKIARIKTAKGVNLERQITKAGGITNSNGGTLKFDDHFDKTIHTALINKLN